MMKSGVEKTIETDQERFVVHQGGKVDAGQSSAEQDDVDNRLVAEFVAGNSRAFDQLVARYKERIYSFIYFQINQRQADAEDLTQDVFVELYRQAANYRGDAKFSTYLYSVSRNIVLNYFRSQRRRHADKTDSISQSDPLRPSDYRQELVAEDCPARQAVSDNMQTLLNQAIDKLNPDERQLLLLTDREGFSYEQISSILSIKVGTVRSRLNTARNRLLQLLKVHQNDL